MAKQKSTEYRSTEEYKQSVVQGQKEWRDLVHGIEELHEKTCENAKCRKIFTWFGRKDTAKYRQTRFCSVPCSKTRSGFWNKNINSYHTICFKYHTKACIVCGFDKVVAAHHYDENRQNNKPLNLIPLCPNHHSMIHTNEYKNEITLIVDKWLEDQILSGKFIRDEDGG